MECLCPPNFVCWSLNSQCNHFQRQDFWEVVRFRWVYKGGIFIMELVSFQKKKKKKDERPECGPWLQSHFHSSPRSHFLFAQGGGRVNTHRNVSHLQVRKRVITKNQIGWHHDLKFLRLQKYEPYISVV